MQNADFSPENVIVVGFAEDDKAYDAVTALNELGTQRQITVEAVTVVTRDEDGSVRVKNRVDNESLAGTASGGVIGLLVGVIGGPLGVLLGGATGLLVGSLFDLDDAEDTDSVLSQVSKSVGVGHPVLIAQVIEQSPEVIDTAMARLSGTVMRRPVFEVEAELAAAEQAQKEAKKKAREELRAARREKAHDDVQAKVDALKAKLGGGKDKDKAPAGAAS